MAFEEDYIMRQMKMIGELGGNMISRLFKLDQSQIDLGEIQNENGEKVSRATYLESLLIEHRYHEAFLVVQALKYKLSYYDFDIVSGNFIKYLACLQDSEKEAHGLTEEKIDYYRSQLQAVF